MLNHLPSASCPAQRGVMLIEALVAIAVFSIGVLGLIGLQSAAIKNTDEARQRAAAAFYANQIIGSMWADARASLPTYAHNAAGSGCGSFSASPSANAKVTDWVAAVQKDLDVVSGVSMQQIMVDPNNVVAVTLCWKSRGESSYHFFTTAAQIQG
jgi:type IV pilus assembly protein PilV